MGTARRVLYAEVEDVEAKFTQRGGGRSTGETSTYDDDVEIALVGGIDELLVGLVVCPLLGEGTFGYLGVYLEFR